MIVAILTMFNGLSNTYSLVNVLGTLPGGPMTTPPTLEDLLALDRLVDQVMRTVVNQEIVLQSKLEDVLSISTSSTTTSTTTTTTTTTRTTTSTTTTTTTTTRTTTSTTTTRTTTTRWCW